MKSFGNMGMRSIDRTPLLGLLAPTREVVVVVCPTRRTMVTRSS